jgi:hypothetical protein
MAKLTAATVNKALKAAGHPERLVQAEGYAYFTEGNRITDVQDLQWWLAQHTSLKAGYEYQTPKDEIPYKIGGILKLGKDPLTKVYL